MNVDPVVRSIRIASTLNDRFGAIVRGANEHQTVAEFELKIGEAQQIYPEIWRHLDEARAALGARSIDVAEYDALRATERPGQQAVDNIEHAEGINPLALAFGGALHVEMKTAEFNREGHAKARAACNALMEAMPEVDWRGLARAEEAEIAAVGSLDSAKWRRLLLVGAIVLAVIVALQMLR
ncbi:MAG: hypothetical protein M4D80_11010 [Myxococcota bacterium]|nr:hypothetical protein [Myxococcota bacterium]